MEYLIYFICILFVPLLFMLLIYFMVYGNNKKTHNKVSGLDVARKILDENNLDMTYVVETKGSMSDIYVYKQKVIRLSSNIYNEENLSSVAVSGTKAATAIMHKRNDSGVKLKGTIGPILDYLMVLSFILIIVGTVMHISDISLLAVAIIVLVLLFNLVTLPINFKIKNKALEELKKNKIVNDSELEKVSKLLILYSFNDISNMVCCINNAIKNLDIFCK